MNRRARAQRGPTAGAVLMDEVATWEGEAAVRAADLRETAEEANAGRDEALRAAVSTVRDSSVLRSMLEAMLEEEANWGEAPIYNRMQAEAAIRRMRWPARLALALRRFDQPTMFDPTRR